eukprot:TRINITY_DN8773_c0_g1_i3.p3 TRINITY_DN8773_c0_g1~~TRINITY_DN8773_c0_g1_i3.p3  ORF type:complete len:119 (-),score=7.49 TRINITY_DN8773_c0_g1_i3:307-630(-)
MILNHQIEWFVLSLGSNMNTQALSVDIIKIPKLYRDCLRVAKLVGQQNGSVESTKLMVRQAFKAHKHETDPEKIQEYKQDAIRGLSNYWFHVAGEFAEKKAQDMEDD